MGVPGVEDWNAIALAGTPAGRRPADRPCVRRNADLLHRKDMVEEAADFAPATAS
jgi:hypothetical protein